MARLALTNSPQALTGITSGTSYSLQNRSPWTVYVDISTSEPTGSDDANVLRPSGFTSVGIAQAASGESVWVWAATDTRRGKGAIIYREAP